MGTEPELPAAAPRTAQPQHRQTPDRRKSLPPAHTGTRSRWQERTPTDRRTERDQHTLKEVSRLQSVAKNPNTSKDRLTQEPTLATHQQVRKDSHLRRRNKQELQTQRHQTLAEDNNKPDSRANKRPRSGSQICFIIIAIVFYTLSSSSQVLHLYKTNPKTNFSYPSLRSYNGYLHRRPQPPEPQCHLEPPNPPQHRLQQPHQHPQPPQPQQILTNSEGAERGWHSRRRLLKYRPPWPSNSINTTHPQITHTANTHPVEATPTPQRYTTTLTLCFTAQPTPTYIHTTSTQSYITQRLPSCTQKLPHTDFPNVKHPTDTLTSNRHPSTKSPPKTHHLPNPARGHTQNHFKHPQPEADPLSSDTPPMAGLNLTQETTQYTTPTPHTDSSPHTLPPTSRIPSIHRLPLHIQKTLPVRGKPSQSFLTPKFGNMRKATPLQKTPLAQGPRTPPHYTPRHTHNDHTEHTHHQLAISRKQPKLPTNSRSTDYKTSRANADTHTKTQISQQISLLKSSTPKHHTTHHPPSTYRYAHIALLINIPLTAHSSHSPLCSSHHSKFLIPLIQP